VVTAHDAGTIINPSPIRVRSTVGSSPPRPRLTEELISDEGRIINGHLGDYKLPTAADVPPETVLVHSPGGAGPYEAKAIGELANNTPPAAIANAVADAAGVRLFELPITAERVYTALRADRR
jgi:CO/xanthine dehydrogenase Mo-binding subunit